MVIPGSEEYLEKGISDFLIMEGINVIGPSKQASLLETSKYFTKKICDISNIKTAKWLVCENAKQAKRIIEEKKFTNPVKKIGIRPFFRLFTYRYMIIYAEKIDL